MPSINELNLVDEEQPPQDVDDLPPQGFVSTPLPKPGTHLFQLPKKIDNTWETVDTQDGQRVKAVFADEATLTVDNANPFRTQISSVERARGKDKIKVSDLAYLLKALGHPTVPRKSSEYINALNGYGGGAFKADVRWSAFCNPKKAIYIYNEDGKIVKHPEGKQGCNTRYVQDPYQSTVSTIAELPRQEDGSWAESFQCGCGNELRVFAELNNFRSA